MPPWASWMKIEDYFYTDQTYLRKMCVEYVQPVPFEQVIDWMSKARFNPVLLRSLFGHLRIVTPRLFETVAADTIPLLVLDPLHVQEIYGEQGLDLILPEESPQEKILDIVRHPERYHDVMMGIRLHMAEKHSHAARLRRLIEIIET